MISRPLSCSACVAALLTAALTISLFAAGAVPNGKPEDDGFSGERLGRIKEAVQRQIDSGNVPGVVTLVARRGHVVHFEAHGMNDVEAKTPQLQRDFENAVMQAIID